MMWTQSTPLKDKCKPKCPMSAYSCFVQVVREEHKRKYPSDTIMNDKEKQRFHDMAAADKERFNKEISEYIPPEGFPKVKKRKTPRDPSQPKRAWSAFFYFCDEFRPDVRAKHPDWNVATVAKELGKRWELCENKAKYEQMSQKDKERYEEDMMKYRNGTYVPPKKDKHALNANNQQRNLSAVNTPSTMSNDVGEGSEIVKEDEDPEE